MKREAITYQHSPWQDRTRLKRLAWLPIPVLFGTIVLLWAAVPNIVYMSPFLVMLLSIFFSVLASVFIVSIITEIFQMTGSPGFLLIGCGVIFWGTAGEVAHAFAHGNANTIVTIHNSFVWLSAICHLAGVGYSFRSKGAVRAIPWWLAAGCVAILAAASGIVFAILSGWLPTFFVQGRGGTQIRLFVLGSAIVMFMLAAGLLRSRDNSDISSFSHWYSLALLLVAVGLFGILIQPSVGGLVGWAGIAAQFLSGPHMIMAVLAKRGGDRRKAVLSGEISDTPRHPYAMAIVIVIAATAAKFFLSPALGTNPSFLTYYPAVIFAALYGGLRAGLLATIFSALIVDYIWMQPEWQLTISNPVDWVRILFFFLSSVMVSLIIEAMHKNRAGLILHQSHLEEMVKSRTAQLEQEIHDRKQAEEALRESEERLRFALETIHTGAWDLDLVGHSAFRSVEHDRIFGYTQLPPEWTYEMFLEHVIPEDRATVDRKFRQAMETQSDWNFECRISRANGQIRWIFAAGRHTEDDATGARRMAGVVQDITERKQMEEALQRRNAIDAGINKILNAALTSPTEEDLGRACLEVAEGITRSKFGFIGRINEEGLEDIAISNPGWDNCKIVDPAGHSALKIHGIYGRIISDATPLMTNDPVHHPDSIGLPEGHPPLESFLGVPLIREGSTIGIVAVGNREGGYSHDDQESLEALGPIIVEAFLRKQAEDAFKKSNDRTAILAGIASTLLQSTNPQELVEELCRKVMDHLKCDAFFNFLIDEDAGRLHLNACAGTPEPIARQIEWLDFGVAVCGTVARDACRIIAENIRENPDPKTELVSSFGIQAYTCHPLFGEEGRVLGTLSFASRSRTYFSEDDISFMKTVSDHVAIAIQRKRTRDELENRVRQRTAELRRLATAVENAAEAIIITDTSWHIEYVNPAFARMTSYTYDDIQRKDLSILRSPDIQDTVYEKARQAAIQNMPLLSRVPIRKKDGSNFTADSFLTPAKDEFGNTTNFVAVWRDVTEHIKLEELLRQSQKMEAIGTLAGGIAHDFNNILAAILGFTEIAIDDSTDGLPVEKSLQNILKSVLRARDLVRQILAFSRKTNYERVPLSLTPIIRETVQLLRASIPANVEINLDIETTSDTIAANPTEVQQIIMNLAANASLAMEERGGTLGIHLTDLTILPESPVCESDLVPGEYVQLLVKDTGTGMSPDVMQRAFEPFFTTRELGEGTGMGLAVVYGIVTDLNGTITIESEPGTGSIFRVLLPKVQAEVKEEDISLIAIPGGTENILFVDDEDMLVEWARATLEGLGYHTVTLTDPAEALSIFASNPSRFDLIITDQSMPSMSGMQLAGEILTIRPDIPIILCTGHSVTVSPEKAKEAGIKHFLMKPVGRQELAHAIRRVLDARDE